MQQLQQSKPQPRGYHKWTTEEIQYVRENYHKDSKASLALRFGVTKEALINLAKTHKIGISKGRSWTEEEDNILLNCTNKSISELAKILKRSTGSIENRRSVLGIKGRDCSRLWEKGETDLVAKWIGHPISLVKQKLDRYCKERNLSTRSRVAIKLKIRQLGESLNPDGYYSLRSLAMCLRTSRDTLKKFIEIHKKELQPVIEGHSILIAETRLQRFAKKYPGEIAKFNPDTIWLISLMTSGTHK